MASFGHFRFFFFFFKKKEGNLKKKEKRKMGGGGNRGVAPATPYGRMGVAEATLA
jgi:hypothetical protein